MTFLITFIPFLFMAYFFRKQLKKDSQSIRLEITWGERCWCCKTLLDKEPSGEKILRICQPCSRDIKISELESVFSKFKNGIKKKLVSDKFRDLINKLIFINLIFLFFYIFTTISHIFQYNLFFCITTTIFNSLFWILLIYHDNLTSIKKPSEKI